MIARLSGTVIEKHPDHLILDVQGVGYHVFISVSTYYKIQDPGNPATLSIHTHVRDDAILLFGFFDTLERRMFNYLISVSGIGPKLALNILSGMEVSALAAAIGNADHAELVRIPGLGKKTAERLVVELRDKMTELMVDAAKNVPKPLIAFGHDDQDVLSALINLGYRQQLAEQAVSRVKKANPDLTGVEPLLRETLKALSKTK